VVRGDVNYIRIGNRVNIQDCAIIHGTYQKNATNVGDNVSIGHGAIIHGCTVHDNVLIGMGAIIMDRCEVQSNSVVAAGAVVLEGTIVESNSIYAGVPAKKVKRSPKRQPYMKISKTHRPELTLNILHGFQILMQRNSNACCLVYCVDRPHPKLYCL
jgi:carbonic anhydrase/acetyltransferase-like protein (isoleucine patch superfamily)